MTPARAGVFSSTEVDSGRSGGYPVCNTFCNGDDMRARKPKSTAGRPALPEAERVSSVNTSISPATRTYLERIGGGSVSRGARLVLADAARENREIPAAENR